MAVSTGLLGTTYRLPPPRKRGVAQPYLLAQLEQGLSGRLRLIAMPAGDGKAAPVRARAAVDEGGSAPARCGRPVAAAVILEQE